jgi:hypothetical protein
MRTGMIMAAGFANFADRGYQPPAMIRIPRRAEQQVPESKRGTHSQSIDPLRPTKAAILQPPIKA